MQPYADPLAEEAAFMPSRRGTFPRQARANRGTLNLFSPSDNTPEQPCGCNRRSYTGHRYPNYESTETREFPSAGIRHVQQPVRSEGPQGIRHMGSVPAAKQSIQVVNISAAYKDPTRMDAPRPSMRVLPEKRSSEDVRASITYAGADYNRQLRGELAEAPVGKARSSAPKRTIDYTRQETFCQAIRDRVQQRARGATEFYVQLCRGTIGGVAATQHRPTPQNRLWSLDEEPEPHTLTLASCQAQLVALTELPVTLFELADLVWDMSACKENGEEPDAAALGALRVAYKDFSAAFGANSHNVRLAIKKI